MNDYLAVISFLMLCSLVLSKEQAPLITIPDGKIEGTSGLTGVGNRTYYAYRGIPFAKPPLGDLRFAAPVKNDPWNGTLDATKDQQSCVQMNSTLAVGESGSKITGSEDCLYINVYTTDTETMGGINKLEYLLFTDNFGDGASSDMNKTIEQMLRIRAPATFVNGNLPVMVWIYGGGFTSGSSKTESYSPDNFLDKDVLFVSFNYRLGVFGFLSTEDEHASGNWGIKDQVMALRWVKDNIQYFGGDPNKITVFGESAGGASVSYLTQTNMTKGLFDRTIMQSGTSLCLWALTRNPRQRAFNVGLRLGIFTLSSKSLIKNLRKANYKDLKLAENNVTIQYVLTDDLLAGLPFGVVTEPDVPGAVFSKKSWELLSKGKFSRGPSIIGYNSNEGAALTAYVDLIRPVLTQYELDVTRLAPFDLTQSALKRLGAGTEIRRHYFGLLGSFGSQPDALTRIVTVDQFNRPIREAVNQVSKFSTVYYYQFSYSGLLANPNQTHKGVGHAEELSYLFYSKGRVLDESDSRTSQKFVTLWTNFAKTGNPTPGSSSENDNLLSGITWEPNNPTSNSESSIKYLNINKTLTMESNPFQDDWTFYKGIYDRYGDPPYTTY